MNTNKNDLESEILFIKKIMRESRSATLDNGKYYILWGLIASFSCIASYINSNVKTEYNGNFIWLPLMAAGWIISIYWGFKDSRKEKNKTLGKKVINGVWAAVGLAALVLIVPGQISHSILYFSICPIIAILLGMGYFICGVVYSDKMLKIFAILWWLGASWMFFIQDMRVLLVHGILLLLLQVIPGLILFSKWKKELALNAANA